MQNAMPLNLADVREKPASAAELTSEQFVRGVALALRAQWEGVDQLQAAAAGQAGSDLEGDWAEFRTDSEVAIIAYLEILRRSGFRIVRNPS